MITIKKCPCGDPVCRDYHLVGIGKFVQGSGFTLKEAIRISFLLNGEQPLEAYHHTQFHDYVVAHGSGPPTEEGYAIGGWLIGTGDDYATAAAEVVARGLTHEPEEDWP